MKNFLVHNEEVKAQMCADIGIKNVDELFERIPTKARMTSLNLNDGLSEMETQKKIKKLAKKTLQKNLVLFSVIVSAICSFSSKIGLNFSSIS